MNKYVYVNEVGPRDGLQNQKTILSSEYRTTLIKQLIEAKLPGIEIGSFVSPKAVPAMAGTDSIVKSLKEVSDCDLSVLIPNMKGYELARDAGAKIMTVVPSATETMNQKNINMSLDDTLINSCKILQTASSDHFITRAYVSVAWECPYEGIVDPDQVLRITEKLLDAGANEIILADTIGAANPASVSQLIKKCVAAFGPELLSAHFHDTRAMALANVCAALNEGIRKFDACIAGLGGCPFAPGAAGNLATEDLCNMLEQMGYQTNVDLEKLNSIVDFCADVLDGQVGGRMTPWLRKVN